MKVIPNASLVCRDNRNNNLDLVFHVMYKIQRKKVCVNSD